MDAATAQQLAERTRSDTTSDPLTGAELGMGANPGRADDLGAPVTRTI